MRAGNIYAAIVTIVLLLCPLCSGAAEEKRDKKDRDRETLEEEWTLQEDADYPDLVARDETGEIMDEFALLQEQDVVFTAAKHKQKAGFSPSAVIVITRKDIEESGATTLTELLRRYPAVHIYMFDPIYPTAEIRGTYRVLLLLDGREANLELFVSPFYSMLPVGLNGIERIEIVLGPNSALYGANAVSAVVNIVSRPPSGELHTDLVAAAGDYGSSIIEGQVEGGWGPLAAKGSFGIDRALSWMDRDLLSKNIKRGSAILRLNFDGGFVAADGGFVTGGGRMFALMGDLDMKEFLGAHVKIEFEMGDFKARAYWYGVRMNMRLDLDLVHPDLGVSLGHVPTFDLDGDTAQVEAQYDLELFENNLLIAGTDFRTTSFRSAQFVESDEVIEYRVGIFLHDEHRFAEKLLLTLGVRFDWNSKTKPAVSPRAALVYNPAGEHYLRLSGGMAFRKPTLMETSTNFKIVENPAFPEIKELFEVEGLSNPDLSNELLTSVELGYRGSLFGKALRLGGDVYLNFDRQNIDFDYYIHFDQTPLGPRIDTGRSRFGYENLGIDRNTVGASIFLEGEPVDELTLFFRGEFRYRWHTRDNSHDTLVSGFLSSTGATLRLPIGITAHLVLIYITERDDDLRSPESILAPTIEAVVPARLFALSSVFYRVVLGQTRLDLGLSWFNPFGASFREKTGVRAADGSNFGGELIGSRAMLMARLHY